MLPPLPSDRLYHLPSPATPLVGREREVAKVCALLGQPHVRLVTLTGTGGVGKTRLAIAVAEQLRHQFRDGVVFVSLGAILDPALLPSAISQAAGFRPSGYGTLPEQLKVFLQEMQMLLVLDNIEQVIDAAPMITDLLASCPGLVALVTSRVVLRLYGEHVVVVAPLDLPETVRLPPVAQLSRIGAVHLFVDRATAARAQFALTDTNANAVADICIRLDGLPLAIELAAARTRMFSPQALLALLERRFQVLTSGPRDVPDRQQTLQAAITWSYDLLSPDMRRLFRCLAIFRNGWTLDAAEAVCSRQTPGRSDQQADLLDGLTTLVDHHLVRQLEQPDGTLRFDMLETIGEYALARLKQAGDIDAASSRHAAWFLGLAEDAESEITGPDQIAWSGRLAQDLDNLRGALTWLSDIDTNAALRLAASIGRFWWLRGLAGEGRARLDELLSRPDADPVVRLKALQAAGYLAERQGDTHAANALLQESLSLCRNLGDDQGAAFSLHTLGRLAAAQGDHAAAATFLSESLTICRQIGDDWNLTRTLHFTADLAYAVGDMSRAATLFDEAMTICRQRGDSHGVAYSLRGLGDIARIQGDLHQAADLLKESLRLVDALQDKPCMSRCIERLAWIAGQQGRSVRAARLFGIAEVMREEQAAPLPPTDHAVHEHIAGQILAEPGRAVTDAWAVGRSMMLDEAVRLALATSDDAHEDDVPAPASLLTRRELDVVRLVVEGRSNQEIADALFISSHTAANHVSNIMNKLGLDSRTSVAAWAVRQRIA